MNTFGEVLGDLLSARGISQKELADALDISATNISNYASNNHYPSVKNLLKIAGYFDVSLDYLFGRTDVSADMSILKSTYANKPRKKGNVAVDEVFKRILELNNDSREDLLIYLDMLTQRDKSK